MVLFYLTNSALDVTAGVLWWVTKNTVSGVCSGVSYLYGSSNDNQSNENKESKDNDEELRKQIEILSNSVNEINEQLKHLQK